MLDWLGIGEGPVEMYLGDGESAVELASEGMFGYRHVVMPKRIWRLGVSSGLASEILREELSSRLASRVIGGKRRQVRVAKLEDVEEYARRRDEEAQRKPPPEAEGGVQVQVGG